MKTNLKTFSTIVLVACCCMSFGHDQPVHFAITLHAAASAIDDSSAFVHFTNTISADVNYRVATNWMAIGSWDEDI
jgi:hypothetical protein